MFHMAHVQVKKNLAGLLRSPASVSLQELGVGKWPPAAAAACTACPWLPPEFHGPSQPVPWLVPRMVQTSMDCDLGDDVGPSNTTASSEPASIIQACTVSCPNRYIWMLQLSLVDMPGASAFAACQGRQIFGPLLSGSAFPLAQTAIGLTQHPRSATRAELPPLLLRPLRVGQYNPDPSAAALPESGDRVCEEYSP
jgi:hypothetical protein